MAKVQDPLSGLWIEEGQLEGRTFSDDYTANYLDRDLFTSFYQYAKDAGRAVAHNERLYDRSAQKIKDDSVWKTRGARLYGGSRQRSQQRISRQRSLDQQMASAMAGQREGWTYINRRAGNRGGQSRVWREYRAPTDFDGSTRGTTKHSLILRKNRV